MAQADISGRHYFGRVAGLLALNVALILAITSPLWLVKAYVCSHIFCTGLVPVNPNGTPKETEPRFVTPPMWKVLATEMLLTALTYLMWVLALCGIHHALAKPLSRSDRLETWAMAANQRLAYLLCWPIPWLGTWVFGLANWFLLPALPFRSAPPLSRVLDTAYTWVLDAWWPTIPVLVFVGLFLAFRRTRRNVQEMHRAGQG